ncbi:MAG: SAM-dependent methyltransferase [Halobacteriaceae archaeon]
MTGKDKYYNKSKQEGYRARSAYKLKQLDELSNLFSRGDTVLDLGAAPGGWLQVAAESIGKNGRLIGVDQQNIEPLEDTDVEITLIRGDITSQETKEEIFEIDPAVDVVLSDMAPNMSGEYNLDHARSVYLARQAFQIADDVLAPDGDFVVKVFEGPDLESFEDNLTETFEYVNRTRPEATREESAELYLIGKHYISAPVTEGDILTVDIESTGDEGDGIAKVDGYTIFVEGADTGDEIEIEVSDVKANYGFASKT